MLGIAAMRTFLYPFVWVVVAVTLAAGHVRAAAGAAWDLLLVPASLNEDRTVKVVAGHVQPLVVMLQASDEIRSQGTSHAVIVEFSLPPGTVVEDQGGQFEVIREETGQDERGRTLAKYTFMIRNDNLVGRPGERPLSEWNSHALFARFPERLEDGADAYVNVRLEHRRFVRGEIVSVQLEKEWPLELYALAEPGVQLERTWVGLWDYTLARAGKAGPSVGAWLAASGVNFIQRGTGEFFEAMRSQGIRTGGYVHHSLFYSPRCPDVRADGTARVNDYADPQCIVDLPEGADVPGVAALVQTASAHDGWATIDYEPSVPSGFSEASLAAFARAAGLDQEAVERFRKAVAENGVYTYLSTDPVIAGLYDKWVAFRTQQVSAYVKRLADEMKRAAPGTKLAVTVNDGFAHEDPTARGYGYVAAEMARYVDAIMPQIYKGYGGAPAKLVLQRVQGWRDAMAQREAKAQLVPILLVRYAGATVRNTPARVRQQIFAALAGGADGFLLYYPANMDAPYWLMLSETTREIAAVEAFYHDGVRVDGEFTPLGMPTGYEEVLQYPRHPLPVQDPGWAYTAHFHDGQYLLTLFNLQSEGDLTFRFDSENAWEVVSTRGVVSAGPGGWTVPAEGVGLVILSPLSDGAKGD